MQESHGEGLDKLLHGAHRYTGIIESFSHIPEDRDEAPAALPDLYINTSRGLRAILMQLGRYRAGNADTGRNRKTEESIDKRLARVFLTGRALKMLPECGAEMRRIHAEQVNRLYTCTYDMCQLACSYKEAAESVHISRRDTVRIIRPERRNDTTVVYRKP